jgi:hypothetical protein
MSRAGPGSAQAQPGLRDRSTAYERGWGVVTPRRRENEYVRENTRQPTRDGIQAPVPPVVALCWLSCDHSGKRREGPRSFYTNSACTCRKLNLVPPPFYRGEQGINDTGGKRERRLHMRGDDERPAVPVGDDSDELEERCRDERQGLTPKETASCAGMDLVREYENEEDGGS